MEITIGILHFTVLTLWTRKAFERPLHGVVHDPQESTASFQGRNKSHSRFLPISVTAHHD
jgi:hypothetical protein